MPSESDRQPYDAFLSCKHSAPTGGRTRDSEIAEALEAALVQRGVRTFRADTALQQLGRADYSRAIAEALEAASVLVVVGTSADFVNSEWIRYEWDTFLNEIRSHRKRGILVTVLEGMGVPQLPIELRQWQSFDLAAGGFDRPCEFIEKALTGLRSRLALERSERFVESGSRTVEQVDRLSRAMARSRITELEITRRLFGRTLDPDDIRRLEEHIDEIRRLVDGDEPATEAPDR